ncbi:hypothetical protein MTO96_009348 [Rhipicephalus appendiculatus]
MDQAGMLLAAEVHTSVRNCLDMHDIDSLTTLPDLIISWHSIQKPAEIRQAYQNKTTRRNRASLLVSMLHKHMSLFLIGLLGSLFAWVGMAVSAFAPTIAWISFTMGIVHGFFRDRMGSYDNLYRIIAGIIFSGGLGLATSLVRSSRSKSRTAKIAEGEVRG